MWLLQPGKSGHIRQRPLYSSRDHDKGRNSGLAVPWMSAQCSWTKLLTKTPCMWPTQHSPLSHLLMLTCGLFMKVSLLLMHPPAICGAFHSLCTMHSCHVLLRVIKAVFTLGRCTWWWSACRNPQTASWSKNTAVWSHRHQLPETKVF